MLARIPPQHLPSSTGSDRIAQILDNSAGGLKTGNGFCLAPTPYAEPRPTRATCRPERLHGRCCIFMLPSLIVIGQPNWTEHSVLSLDAQRSVCLSVSCAHAPDGPRPIINTTKGKVAGEPSPSVSASVAPFETLSSSHGAHAGASIITASRVAKDNHSGFFGPWSVHRVPPFHRRAESQIPGQDASRPASPLEHQNTECSSPKVP